MLRSFNIMNLCSKGRDKKMKKIFLSLLFTAIVITTASAVINTQTHEQLVEEYLEISGQGEAFAKVPTQMMNMLEEQFATTDDQTDPELLNLMVEGFTKDETTKKLTEDIRKLSSKDLHKLIIFYKTKTGQKCAKLNKEEGMEDIEKDFPAFLQNLQTNPPSQHRIDSMNAMFTKANILTGTLQMVEAVTRIYNASVPKENQMNDAQIEGMMMQVSQLINQQLIVSFYYSMRDFTDDEVDEIVKITLTPEGQAETDAQLAGISAYITTAATDLVDKVSKLQK